MPEINHSQLPVHCLTDQELLAERAISDWTGDFEKDDRLRDLEIEDDRRRRIDADAAEAAAKGRDVGPGHLYTVREFMADHGLGPEDMENDFIPRGDQDPGFLGGVA